jgi:methylenetetrahydrofolate dehydrogenase (NADP+)/methenyltetrahydrofolate cyclohydrolase
MNRMRYTIAMKLLDGRDVAGFIKERHRSQVAGLEPKPRLAIIRSEDNEAGDQYLKMKRRYGEDIDVPVDLYVETEKTILKRIDLLNDDDSITGIIIQLPLPNTDITDRAVSAVRPEKDIDGLSSHTEFETATPKAALWLLAAYNVDIKGRIVIVGQGRLVGKPLADRLEAAGHKVVRCDVRTKDLRAATREADIIFTGTGRPSLITSDMVKLGAVVVDTGAPAGELAAQLYERDDLTITPNPGGVGPMTVAALFDNLLIAAMRTSSHAASREQ